jgi:two-component system LytT family response regulator
MDRLRIIHLDDDPISLSLVEKLCQKNSCLEYLAGISDSQLAIQMIREKVPDIVILDVKLNGQSGIELALSLQDIPVSFAFLTSHTECAMAAYRADPLIFLSKPMTAAGVDTIINRWKKRKPLNTLERFLPLPEQKAGVSIRSEEATGHQRKIFIPTMNSIKIVDLDKLMLIEALSNYTSFHIADQNTITSSRNLKVYADILTEHPDFIRVHRSYLVNRNFVREIKRAQKGKTMLALDNGRELEVAVQRKDLIFEKLKN